jgi:hypothetical protein
MTIYVFGYGALLNLKTIKELDQTKKRKTCPVMVQGLKRSLNVEGQQHRVFGVKDVPSAHCNGILFTVSATELGHLIEREKLYTLKPLAKERIEFPYKKCIHFQPADQVVCFYPQRKFVLSQKELAANSVLHSTQSYVDRCKRGAAEISAAFYADFI